MFSLALIINPFKFRVLKHGGLVRMFYEKVSKLAHDMRVFSLCADWG